MGIEMSNEKEHWCFECYYYNGDTSIGEICNRTGKSTHESRPSNSTSCDMWMECICGPLNWEDVQTLHIITEKYMRELDKRIEAFPSSSQEVFEEIIRRYKGVKK